MQTKLTLSIDKKIVDRAKGYARKRKKSVSEIVEEYFRNLTEEEGSIPGAIPPLTGELAGILKKFPEIDREKERIERLERRFRKS